MTEERVKYVASLVYLDAGEAADLLRISRKQVYRLVHAGLLPVTKIGRGYVFSRVDLDEFMAGGNTYTPVPMSRASKRALAAN